MNGGTETARVVWRRVVGPLDGSQSAAVLVTAAASAMAVWRTTRGSGRLPAGLSSAVVFDLVGGLVAFQLPPTREAYGDSSLAARLGFAAAHVQPFALPLTGEGGPGVAAARYGAAVVATAALESLLPASPRRRTVANALAAGLSVVGLLASRGDRQRWPVYLMKVVGGHGGIPRREKPRTGVTACRRPPG